MRRWWRRRTLHDRLALLVTGAVATAVVVVAGAAWVTVAEIQQRRLQSELATDASAIAASPPLPPVRPPGAARHERHGPRLFGPRWQILDPAAAPVAPGDLPITDPARAVAAGRTREAREEVEVGGRTYLMLTVRAEGGGAVQVAIDQGPTQRTLTVFGLLLALGCAVGIAFAAALGRAVARAGLAPVQRVATAIEDVTRTMDLSRPVAVSPADDEIARLGTSVNTLLAAIDTAQRAQRALVEDAGHELRTPLTSLRTNIELLIEVERHPDLAHRLPPGDREQLLADLGAQVGELTTLTTELVELAREETTRETPEPVDLTDIIGHALSRVRRRAPARTFTTALEPVVISGRPGELERMVVNVLDNAAKWSPDDGTVHIGLRADGDRAELTVTDEGPGIDEADRPFVFDRFYRAPAARSTPGSGLGLAIVAQTAARHGGSATTAPHAPRGTAVTISLPRIAQDEHDTSSSIS